MTRSYIKIYGPPIGKGLRALEQVAVDMSKETTMRFFSALTTPPLLYDMAAEEYGAVLLPQIDLPTKQKVQLVSHAATALGDYDFFFEWGAEPTTDQVMGLIEKIDTALAKCKCMYTITTK